MTPNPATTSSPAPAPAGHLFLVGLPRTGSTLLRHVLNRSPSIAIASETHFMARSRRLRLAERLAAAGRSSPAALGPVVTDVLDRRFWPWLGRNIGREALEQGLAAGGLTPRDLFELMLVRYGEVTGTRPLSELLIGEKTPAHLATVPTLAAWFPDARFVHTLRDPRGVYASRLRRAQAGEWGLKARLPRVPGWLLDPLLPPIEAAYAARSWIGAVRAHDRYAAQLGSRYLLVRFEDLVATPQPTIRRVCAFAGVAFEPAMLENADIVGSSFEAARHAGVGFDPAVADRWREEVSPVLAALIGAVTRPWLRRMGYRP